ncbi:MAG: hypothetical protein LBS23_02670 [Holosporaceae bacterium]|nr:hypothetical protein [Holosporaceae bacterium]
MLPSRSDIDKLPTPTTQTTLEELQAWEILLKKHENLVSNKNMHKLNYIICMLKEFHGNTVSDWLNMEKRNFLKAFEKIASSSVGRVLLYRIMIEIMRKQKNDMLNLGCAKDGQKQSERAANRNVQIFIDIPNFVAGTTSECAKIGIWNKKTSENVFVIMGNALNRQKDVCLLDTEEKIIKILSAIIVHETAHLLHRLINYGEVDELLLVFLRYDTKARSEKPPDSEKLAFLSREKSATRGLFLMDNRRGGRLHSTFGKKSLTKEHLSRIGVNLDDID